MALGDNIFEQRKKAGLSQESLGYKIGVTRQTVSNWELNETSPNTEQLKAMSKLFGVSVDELIDNDLSEVILSEVKNTRKQNKLRNRLLKGVLIVFAAFLIVDIITFAVCYARGLGPFNKSEKENKSAYVTLV